MWERVNGHDDEYNDRPAYKDTHPASGAPTPVYPYFGADHLQNGHNNALDVE